MRRFRSLSCAANTRSTNLNFTNGSDRRSDKEFLEAGKKRLEGDLAREATTDEVSDLRKENARLKEGAIRIFDGSRNYMLNTGDAFIARKNRLAKYELLSANEGFEPVLFCFDESFLKEFQQKHAPVRSDRQVTDAFIEIKNNRFVSSFIESIKPYYRGVMALDEDFEDVKYEELLIILLKTHPGISSFLFDFARPDKINLEAFMNKNFAFDVGAERFATLTGRSISAFKRDFKEIYHQPPSQWLVERRLREAYLLISKKAQKPADIYLDLGFKSLSHFSVAFKKQFNCTPTRLAKENNCHQPNVKTSLAAPY